MTLSFPRPLRIGTRGSPLALYQANEVRRQLAARHPALAGDGMLELVTIVTTGDAVRDRPLAELGGKGLFTKDIEDALIDGRIDLAVHSMKDVPTWLPPGLGIVAMLPREDPRDVLVLAPPLRERVQAIAHLPQGAVVGTVSLRRQSQILHHRPDLRIVMLRGNVGTRLRRLEAGELDATLLAMAGLVRLGLQEHCRLALDPQEMLPAVGQGVIGIEARLDDEALCQALRAIDDATAHCAVTAERAMLGVLDGSCRTPIGGLARLDGDRLALDGVVAMPDGSLLEREMRSGDRTDPVALGLAVGESLRSRAPAGLLEGGAGSS